jgi:hypothetical protein
LRLDTATLGGLSYLAQPVNNLSGNDNQIRGFGPPTANA